MKLFEFIGSALREDNHKPSLLRLNTFIGFTQWSAVMTLGFIWTLIAYPYLILGYLTILCTLTAAIIGLKVFQKDKEQNMQGPNEHAE
jgi:hypothetical protein